MVTLNPEVSDKIFNDWVKGYAGRERPVCVECSKKKGKVVAMKAGSSRQIATYYYCPEPSCKSTGVVHRKTGKSAITRVAGLERRET